MLLNLKKRQIISIFKGSLAYTLSFILIFLSPFNKLNKYPVVLSSIVLITLAGGPGKSIGACWDAAIFGGLGVGFGAIGFILLANLGESPVAQGFVFFIIVYFFSIVKAQSMRYFGFSLLGIIMSFSGIYTSILLGGVYSSDYLVSYLLSYAWGFLLVLTINILVLPTTAERELREVLSSSLDHISTFSHLISKTYVLEITEEEKVVRDELNQSIRADFAFLSQRLGETSLEINWTRWKIADYSKTVAAIRNMQQGLITSYSSLNSMELDNPDSLEVIKKSLSQTGNGLAIRAFSKLRSGTALCIDDILEEFAVGDLHSHSPAAGNTSWDDFKDFDNVSDDDLESAEVYRPRQLSVSESGAARNRLRAVSSRFKEEVKENYDTTPIGSRRNSVEGEGEKDIEQGSRTDAAKPGGSSLDHLDHPKFLRDCWRHYEVEQNRSVTELLSRGVDEDEAELRLHQPGPSLHELYSHNPKPSASTTARQSSASKLKQRHSGQSTPDEERDALRVDALAREEPDSEACGMAVMRTYSFLFGMGEVVRELADLHEFICPKSDQPQRTKSLHFHFFEKIPKPSKPTTSMSLPEALAILQGRVYEHPKTTLWSISERLQKVILSENSFYAFKVALAVSCYAVFILAPSLQSFFVTYALTGGIITIVVAIAPTLGQSLLTFLLQIAGTGFGSIVGLIILLIFKGVGGYYWNPYGMVCLLAVYSILGNYIIYVKPQFFAGALLALNGTGVLIVTEWTYREVEGFVRPTFDSAALRAGKALVAMSIAIVIAAVFMIIIFRTPSRKTLRIKLSELTFNMGSYNILFSAVGEAIVPLANELDKPRPPPEAIDRVKAELVRREGMMQGQLLALMPLLKFSAAEFSMGKPFKGKVISRIIRNHQLILDRLREARTAALQGFSEEIQVNFTRKLSPYRRQTKRFSRALFYLIASSISTKTPLPHELPSLVTIARAIQHDAVLLSKRLSKEQDGREIIKSNSFLRYFFYLVSYSSVSNILESMEGDLRILFGEVEDHILR